MKENFKIDMVSQLYNRKTFTLFYRSKINCIYDIEMLTQKLSDPIETRLGKIVGGAKPKVQCEN